MSAGRRNRIIDLLSVKGAAAGGTRRLCEVCAEATGTSGAGIMLMAGDVSRGSICTTDSVSALIEQLQYDLGEGPCIDAFRLDQPVFEADLADPWPRRWMSFTPAVLAAGARAVYGFPLRIGAVRMGALNLYNVVPGELADEQHADALVMADIAAQAVLMLQAGAAPGTLADELAERADFRYVVQQAAGMVAVQLGVAVGEALVRLRAHAFASGSDLTQVAEQVVAGRLRFPTAEIEPHDENGAPS